ncbi:hypothetical protein P167DRAFT_548452 [Morchella conica CCBAS932]|uniref:Uncharacterized protein n=1 Tax=Morchella conica CCBAS932 TaxID=1392247 RepID=A0A3N4KTG4_9PEZI|nr:hypothetical protein P167DRAFT_548452 [Morchella conica CCBAS932]
MAPVVVDVTVDEFKASSMWQYPITLGLRGDDEVFIKPTDEASTASTPRPRPLRHRSSASAVHLAVKKGECEHSKLLASGMVLFAMNPRLSARYENTNEKDEEFPMEDTAQLTVPWCIPNLDSQTKSAGNTEGNNSCVDIVISYGVLRKSYCMDCKIFLKCGLHNFTFGNVV